MPRFFRRFAEGVFDLDDLKLQTDELARLIDLARREYTLENNRFVAIGYSNGANIASSLMLLHPKKLAGAVLFRAMVPFAPDELPDLSETSILLSAGRRDPIVPVANTLALQEIFRACGADVTLQWYPGGHELGQADLQAAKEFLSKISAFSPL